VKLLIVEDEPFIAADLESLTLELGHSVVGVADTKASAFEMVRTLSPDAALVDIKLRDGFTGTDVARALGHGARVPFAFVSGNTEMLPAEAFGAIAVVQKPFSDIQIVDVLKHLARRCGEDALKTMEGPEPDRTLAADPSGPISDPLS
jgi:CheY-like chemotaxis protein